MKRGCISQLRHKTEYNAPMDLPVAVENAWSAVVEMREAVRETAAQFGDDDEVTNALQEMLR